MAKTTKKVRGIHSLIKFQRHQGVESLTIEGKQELADLSQDKNGDTTLILNADKDKVNEVASSVPYLEIAHTTTGTAPNQKKTATVSQDLTQFPLSGGKLVTVEKTAEGLILNDEKVKDLVETKAEALKEELGSGAGGTARPITLNGGELVKVDKSGDTLTLNDSKVKELVETTKTEILSKLESPAETLPNVYNFYAIEVLSAQYTITGESLSYSTFIISTLNKGQYENHFVYIPLSSPKTEKLSENLIVRITPSSTHFTVELFFKDKSDLTISGVDYMRNSVTSKLTINNLSETYFDVNSSLIRLEGNVPQPLKLEGDHL